MRALAAPLALLTHSAHVFRHATAAVAQDTLMMYHDTHLLARSLSPEDWEGVSRYAREFRVGLQTAAVLGRDCELWGPCCPAEAADQLRPRGPGGLIAHFALSHGGWLGWRSRTAVLHACAAGPLRDASRYLVGNLAHGTS